MGIVSAPACGRDYRGSNRWWHHAGVASCHRVREIPLQQRLHSRRHVGSSEMVRRHCLPQRLPTLAANHDPDCRKCNRTHSRFGAGGTPVDVMKEQLIRRKTTMRAFALPLAILVALGGCKTEKTASRGPVHPRAVMVDPRPIPDDRQVIGEVRPRYESDLSFRVTGKVLARLVDVGASVKQGDTLATLDTGDFKIACARPKRRSHPPMPCSSKPKAMRRARPSS